MRETGDIVVRFSVRDGGCFPIDNGKTVFMGYYIACDKLQPCVAISHSLQRARQRRQPSAGAVFRFQHFEIS